jgi:hypothetical protein
MILLPIYGYIFFRQLELKEASLTTTSDTHDLLSVFHGLKSNLTPKNAERLAGSMFSQTITIRIFPKGNVLLPQPVSPP